MRVIPQFCFAQQGYVPSTANAPPPSTVFAVLKIGAGGYLTGMDMALDAGGLTSTKVVRTDTYGAYWLNPSVPNPGNAGGTGAWQQLVTTTSMPNGFNGPDTHYGVYEIRIAPSNTSRFYMSYGGNLFTTTNRGANWSHTNYANDSSDDPNDNNRGSGQFMAVDPANESVVIIGSLSNKVQYSLDAGVTFTTLSALNAPGSGANNDSVIAFDPSSSVVSGKTQGIYIGVGGTGVYHSTGGMTGTFNLISGTGPTTFSRMIIATTGVVWVTDRSGTLWKYTGSGAWASVSVNADPIQCIAVDPTNAAHLFAFVAGGKGYASPDAGTTWFGPTNGTGTGFNLVATDIPWLQNSGETFFTLGNILIDPASTGNLWISEGIGVWSVTYPPISGANWNFGNILTANSVSAAIEQLVTNWAISPWVAGSKPILCAWDRALWRVTNPDVYPSDYLPTDAFRRGSCADWASNSPATIVAITDDLSNNFLCWKSSDGGATWAQTASNGGVNSAGGSICAASSTNFVWVPGNNIQPVYTKNGGTSWTSITTSGVPGSGEMGWNNVNSVNRITAAADRVNIGTFYVYNYGPASTPSVEGMWVSTDNGDTWVLRAHGLLAPVSENGSLIPVQMRTVPGHAGHSFFTGGGGQSITTGPTNVPLYRTTDGFTTVSDVSNGSYTIRQVDGVGIGAAAPGASYPAIYIFGFVNGVCGMWRSIDNCATWQQLSGVAPTQSMDFIRFVEADGNTYGTIYTGFGGSGFAYGKLQ